MTKPKVWRRYELTPIKNRPENIQLDPAPQVTNDKLAKLKGVSSPLLRSKK